VIAAMSSVEGLTVGAGTVLDADQARLAIDCGARFLVSPGFSDPVADVSEASGVPFLPGGATPTDVIRILERGLSTVKFFPAEAMGGLPVLTAFAGPFPQVSFVPTGGIGPGSAAEWLPAPPLRGGGRGGGGPPPPPRPSLATSWTSSPVSPLSPSAPRRS